MVNEFKKKSPKSRILTPEDKENIKRLLYRGLREGETVVDNSSITIAKELRLPHRAVQEYIGKI